MDGAGPITAVRRRPNAKRSWKDVTSFVEIPSARWRNRGCVVPRRLNHHVIERSGIQLVWLFVSVRVETGHGCSTESSFNFQYELHASSQEPIATHVSYICRLDDARRLLSGSGCQLTPEEGSPISRDTKTGVEYDPPRKSTPGAPQER